MSFLDKYTDHSYALLRIVSGLLFLFHGTQKFFNFPTDFPWPLSNITIAAGAIELVAGVLIMVGLFTRPAAFVASGLMAVAYWMAHGTSSLFPIANGGELAVLYCFIFLFIAAKGSGIWSADGKMAK